MVDAIVREVELRKHYLTEPVETIYFGGGTPSILSEGQLGKIVEAIYENFNVNSSIEFTLEANPDDLNQQKLYELFTLGINRLSIGTQSFNNSVLKQLNRSHSAEQARKAVELSRKTGIDNLSLDLIYGIPYQDRVQWQANLDEIVRLDPNHISCYALTIEENTVFGNWSRKGKLTAKDDEQVAQEYHDLVSYLTQKGYEHYEVSNFAKPGFKSQHNTSYWKQIPYLGLGPGAHSFNGNERHFNISNNPKYIKGINEHTEACSQEALTPTQLLTEHIFTRIRTNMGVDFNQIEKQYDYTLNNQQLSFIESLVHQKMATFVENKLILNSKGFFLSDSIALELIPEP